MNSLLRVAVPAIVLFTAACAGTPPVPSASLQAAQQSISNAERAGAGEHAATELAEARAKISSAQRAVDKKEMRDAEWLADEARAEADLAVAKTGAAKANAANADTERSTRALMEEMERKTGDNR